MANDISAGNINASLSLNASKFLTVLQQATAMAKKAGLDMQVAFGGGSAGAAGAIENTNNAVQKTNSGLKDMKRIVGGILISQLFYNAIGYIKDAASALVGFDNDMQQAQISMVYFLGNEAKAKSFVATMQDFAATTPFTTQQALDLSRSLMGMGFAADSVESVMTTLTDAASVTGTTREQMDRIVLALGQVKTQGFLAGQEIRQFANANIPILAILQQQLGLTGTQMKDIGKIKIPADIGIAAIMKGLQRYKGASARIADTFKGMWSTIGDDSLIVGSEITAGPFNALTKLTAKIRDTFESARKAFAKNGIGGLFDDLVPPSLRKDMEEVLASTKALFVGIGALAKDVGPSFAVAFGIIVKSISIVEPIIAGIITGIATLIQKINSATPALKIFGGAILLLLTANLAADALMFLWSVARLGAICTAIAKAVMTLVEAMRFLYTISLLIDAPLLAIIALTAYLALTSKQAGDALDYLRNKLNALVNIKLPNLAPSPDAKNSTDEFNKALTLMNDNLTQTGADALASSDAMKGWVASFDEVNTITDKSTIGSTFPEAPNIPIPDFSTDLPKIDIGSILPSNADFSKVKDKLTNWLNDIKYAILGISVFKPPDPPNKGGFGKWMDDELNYTTGLLNNWRIKFFEWWQSLEVPSNLPLFTPIGVQLTKDEALWKASWNAFWPTLKVPVLNPMPAIEGILPYLQHDMTSWKTSWDAFWPTLHVPLLIPMPAMESVLGYMHVKETSWKASWDALWPTLHVPSLTPMPTIESIHGYLEVHAVSWKSLWDNLWPTFHVPSLTPMPAIDSILGYLYDHMVSWKTLWDSLWPKLQVPSLTPIPAIESVGSYLSTKMSSWKSAWDTFWANIKAPVLPAPIIPAPVQTPSPVPSTPAPGSNFLGNVLGDLKGLIPAIGNGGGLLPSIGDILGSIPAFASGGIVDKHSIIQFAENGREAAIPLSGQAMLPFAQAIVNAMGMTPQMQNGNGNNNQLPTVYVHTLIADDAGLKMLERKLNVIRINESERRGG